ncbi:MAG: NADPH-dependent FMN reductase [Armatimonadota bacterium]
MSRPVHVLGFAGSLRHGSYNRAALRAAAEIAPPDMALEVFDLSPIPLFNADVEAVGVPEPVQQFKDRIAASDALLIVTPEYNYSVSGVLKNAIDWASRPLKTSPLNRKPMAMMGAGGMMGTVRAQHHLRQIALHNDMLVLGRPQVYIARAFEKFDAQGHLTDEPTRQAIRALLEALIVWTRQLQTQAALV